MSRLVIREKGQIDKKDYWHYELRTLGLHLKRDNDLNHMEDLEYLADVIKQSMYEDYKLAYSKDGDKHKDEAEATIKS